MSHSVTARLPGPLRWLPLPTSIVPNWAALREMSLRQNPNPPLASQPRCSLAPYQKPRRWRWGLPSHEVSCRHPPINKYHLSCRKGIKPANNQTNPGTSRCSPDSLLKEEGRGKKGTLTGRDNITALMNPAALQALVGLPTRRVGFGFQTRSLNQERCF